MTDFRQERSLARSFPPSVLLSLPPSLSNLCTPPTPDPTYPPTPSPTLFFRCTSCGGAASKDLTSYSSSSDWDVRTHADGSEQGPVQNPDPRTTLPLQSRDPRTGCPGDSTTPPAPETHSTRSLFRGPPLGTHRWSTPDTLAPAPNLIFFPLRDTWKKALGEEE